MKLLLQEISKCTTCQNFLTHGCRPVMNAHADSKIIIIGQAPGIKVHLSGIPWQDKSGDNLRQWLGISVDQFYDARNFAIIPMGFCYPGKGKSGDLPPRPECAPQWHPSLLNKLGNSKLTLLIGQYAQKYYLVDNVKRNLTETVKNYKEYLPQFLPLPHPSPRNNIWKKKNPWFEEEVIPSLQNKIEGILGPDNQL